MDNLYIPLSTLDKMKWNENWVISVEFDMKSHREQLNGRLRARQRAVKCVNYINQFFSKHTNDQWVKQTKRSTIETICQHPFMSMRPAFTHFVHQFGMRWIVDERLLNQMETQTKQLDVGRVFFPFNSLLLVMIKR